ncbi:LLM class flavin-dependent oxidoreductase [Microlunatus flavus]|uniref:Flavin-dependent oxidoreductase, luciferase family (Includes alkanesulfonate monooxygenase SsuD and methylene tetrahydromethanopterin reductase) n=1 Tax=Microlunatus flavus TaxID=1036181 RepID=A0A1H9M3P1_9ACTN|nr:LLM class flavin-dependent oxidoreductase [Microlunatus flavus]SER18117.1 Flavin-dependent oxidoreductase, luciferase family (includes alkanesulfonate monooxygenase SsuD and methylene tetrahydromethanopterin reductase) [Microlunatus flavus]
MVDPAAREVTARPTPTGAGPSAERRRPLRFGAVAPVVDDLASWHDQLRRLADTGYSTVLMPDVPGWQPAPGPTLAVAATLTGLRVGTWVYAAPVRPAWITAWEAHSLSVLTGGRFEMGIGTGRPGIADLLRELDLPDVPVSRRAEQVREVIIALRDLDGPDLHTPVAMAVGGPKARALAAEHADIVNFVMPQTETRADTARRVTGFGNPRGAELALHVPVIGDAVAPFMAGPDVDTAAVRAADSLAYLPADPAAAAEEIRRRRDELGFSYVVVGAGAAETLAPAVAELAGT